MASQKQLDANRRNAQLSTGPVTPEGKAAVARNALKHGLTAEHAVIHTEDKDEFNDLLQSFEEHLQPEGPVETLLVQQIAMAAWRLSRLRGLETGLFEMLLLDEREDLEECTGFTRHDEHAYVFLRDARRANSITLLGRYETRIERAFYRALHELQRLQAARQGPAGPPPAAQLIAAKQTQFPGPQAVPALVPHTPPAKQAARIGSFPLYAGKSFV